ncbi:DUF885 family protein [Sphingomonas sp. AP4-R1]|uniref:DUF885 domain-containing protein n=1 Tax=Sphingomonas sp. AP4-R1 TaxID=2735134 RepID=UPI001493A151|nr:DUF885 family protein [Sphingomonas sp. AP4-R1]QJU58516.1 DUF885 family protein [Sphingomonas sp. AP4-R1]
MQDLNRRDFLASGAAVAALAALPARAAAGSATDAAAENLLAMIAQELLGQYPENASYYGLDSGPGAALKSRLADRSIAAEQSRATWAAGRLADIKAIDRATVAPGTALNLDVAQTAFDLAVQGWKFPFGEMGVLNGQNSFRNAPYVTSQLCGAFVDQPDFLDSRHVIENAADADAYLARLDSYGQELADENARIAADAARGIILPDFLLDITIGQIAGAAAQPVDQSGLVRSVADRAAKAGVAGDYATRAAAIVNAKVLPALQGQLEALRAARAKATPDAGVWKFPEGPAWYDWALRFATTTTRSPEEIHAIGQQQVKELQARMDAILRTQGMTQGTVGERMDALGKRPDQLFANDDKGRAELLAYLNGRIADVRGRLPRAFHTLVKGNLIIKRVPPSIQDGAPNGYAAAGSIDGTRPGNYYINLKDTGIWPRLSLPTLCYHEGIPGHVWQGEYANRLPLIRTYLTFNAYSEGWGLYAEQLASELGVYEGDPYGELGFLQSIAFRACRLVVDTGIHVKRWTPQQSVAWFQANTGMPRGQLVSEVNRYCAMPAQACGYKMGHNEILRLRDKAKAALGPRYDLRGYDDVVVGSGNVPLTLLERVVDTYIAKARG